MTSFNRNRIEAEHVVLVIHGVGDPQPGETLSLFSRSIARHDQPLVERQEVMWLNEKCEDRVQVRTFATHLRHLQYGNQTACLAEVFWGDLSRVRRGVVGAALGLIEILFGIRYIAYVAAHQAGAAAAGLKRLGLVATNVMHGPVLAVTFFLALLAGALFATEMMWPESHKTELWARVLLMASSMAALAAGTVGHNATRNSGIRAFWGWVNVVATFMLGLMLVKIFFLDSLSLGAASREHWPGLIWYCRVLVMLLGLLWLVETLMVSAMGVCWAASLVRPGAHRPALHVAFLLPAIAVGFWGFALPVAWLVVASSLTVLAQVSDFKFLFVGAMPLLGVQLIMVASVSFAAGLVLLRYVGWRRRMTAERLEKLGAEPPRLILHGGLQGIMVACTVLGVPWVAAISALQFQELGHERYLGSAILTAICNYAAMLFPAIPAGFVVFLVFPHLRPVLDIVLDVMNHFYFRPTRVEDVIDDDEFDIRETTIEKGRLFFARRDAVHLRIKRILAHFRDNTAGRPTLTIISHSQGTMIAIEVLNDPELSWLNSSFSSVRLVTMGSPLRHLYQHYFRHLYPNLDSANWKSLKSRLDRWINIYRLDDFVGTRIDFPKSGVLGEPRSGEDRCAYSNHALGPYGHMNYWSDRAVLAILQRELLRQPDEETALDPAAHPRKAA